MTCAPQFPTDGLSIVIPAHNEAPTISAVIADCRSYTEDVVVVDDGSHDKTAELARQAGARVVRLPQNRGKGAALRVGIEQAVGEVLVFIDADGQDDASELPDLLAALGPGVDMVIGSRFKGTFEPGAITRINWLGSQVLTTFLNLLFRAHITDPFAGFRVVRRRAVAACTLRAERYDIEVDLLLAILSAGGRVVEVPVRRMPRAHGASGLDSAVDGARILWRILDRRLDRVRSWRQVSAR
ncbi:MAG: glycosyltransferase family 2 protein [Nannocystaceae bacterium]